MFTLEYPPFHGGVANYYYNIVKFWPDKKISVLHNNDGGLIKNWLYPKWLPAGWRLWRAVKNNKIDHILVGHILPLGTVAYFITKITKTPYSVFLHGMDFTFACRTARKKMLAKKILTKAENIICGNSYTAKLVGDFLNNEQSGKITVVNPGIDSHETCLPRCAERGRGNTEHACPAARSAAGGTRIKNQYNLGGKMVLLTVGRLVKRKGFDKVIEAMPKVLKEAPNLIYVILGNGQEITNYKLQITNLSLEKNVIIITDADDEEKNCWYNLCDIFIMPARTIGDDFEGFGIVYLEANLAGKPVIAGDSGGVRDAVVNGVNGLLVNPENTNEIADAVIKLARDENLRKKLGEQGRDRAVKEFNWEKQVQIIYQLMMQDK
ncbi:glycosyltransferase family 4 protein [Patescibacteria group bacterium]|nr:glycosyltransferase family 4 protein [Patescibacteria group bacterium]